MLSIPILHSLFPASRDIPVVAGMVGVGVMDYHGSNDDRRQTDQLHASYVEKMKSFVLWLVDNGRSARMFTTDVHDELTMSEVIAHLHALRPQFGPSQIVAEPVRSAEPEEAAAEDKRLMRNGDLGLQQWRLRRSEIRTSPGTCCLLRCSHRYSQGVVCYERPACR
jgi:hypothetical protein